MIAQLQSLALKPRTLPAVLLALWAACLMLAGAAAIAQSPPSARVIKITAERYEYSPEKVVLKKGEPVILELTSRDRLHGFHIKGLPARADVLPGQTVRVRVVPDKTGSFPFTCDLFCGSGHTEMSGMISVVD